MIKYIMLNIYKKNFLKLFLIGIAFTVGYLVVSFSTARQVEAQFYPPTVDFVSAILSGDQNSVTFSANGEGGCNDDIDPSRPCTRQEYVDLGVNFDVQKIVNNSFGGNQWAGYIYYPAQTVQWDFPGIPSPQQRNPADLNGTINTSAWPSGTYRFCATVEGSVTALWPEDAFGSESRCTATFTITRAPTFTCTASPNPVSINPGDSTAFTITTSPSAGFSSPVTFTSSINPNTGTPPSVSIDAATNGRTPPATTTANVSSTASTTAGTYSITFTGTGGGETAQCSVQLTVNPAGRNFNLVIQPGTSTTGNPNATIVGNNYNFTVFAECTGGFAGPVSNLVASTAFAGAVITFTNSGYTPPNNNRLAQLNCGSTTPLVVSTSSIGAEQQSTPQNFLLRDITVTGEGQL